MGSILGHGRGLRKEVSKEGHRRSNGASNGAFDRVIIDFISVLLMVFKVYKS